MNWNRLNKFRKVIVYIILWLAGFTVAGSILILWNNSDKYESINIFTNLDIAENKKLNNNIVDELLLSANELKIYGNSIIIDYSFNDNNLNDEVLIEQIKANPGNAYQNILKNKMDKLKKTKKPVTDFIIKPVPK